MQVNVCIIVSGGLVQGVRADADNNAVAIEVVDFDNLRDSDELHPITGQPWTEEQRDDEDARIVAEYPVVVW